jgi:hypothetical protein
MTRNFHLKMHFESLGFYIFTQFTSSQKTNRLSLISIARYARIPRKKAHLFDEQERENDHSLEGSYVSVKGVIRITVITGHNGHSACRNNIG